MSSLDDVVMFGRLLAVRVVDHGDGDGDGPYLKSVIFNFETGHLRLLFDEEYATLNIESGPQADSSGAESASPIWRDLIGTRASWVWVMTNQNGHEDGLQIEFLNSEANTTAAVQVVTGAANLVVSTVKTVEL